MRSIPKYKEAVKISGTIFPGGGDKALLESNLSTLPAHRGELYRSSREVLSPYSDGANAINSPANDVSFSTPVDSNTLDVSSGSFPASVGLSDLRGTNCDTLDMTRILSEFRKYKHKLVHTPGVILHIRNKSDKSEAIYKSNPRSKCRYFPEGRATMQRNIRERLGREQKSGVFLSLTVAASDWDMMDAWSIMWRRFKGFRDALNRYRKTNMNAEHSFQYLAALEPCESGYPHMHVFCPGLRWLIKKEDLHKMDEWWKMGSVRTEKERREESACSYVLKYISKLEGWSEPNMALLWYYKLRLYNLSHRFYNTASEPEWEKVAQYTNTEEIRKGLGISHSAVDEIVNSTQNFIYIR